MSKTFKEPLEVGDLIIYVGLWGDSQKYIYLVLEANKMEDTTSVVCIELTSSVIFKQNVSLKNPQQRISGWFTLYDYYYILKPIIKF